MEFLSSAWILLCTVLLVSALLFRKSGRGLKLPPSPTRLPILGNLHLISNLPHRSLCKLAQKYGPIMTIYLGSFPTIVISSSHMAEQFLRNYDHIFASRPVMGGDNDLLSPQKLTFSPYGPYWKFMRKFIIQELLSPNRMRSFASLRAQEVFAMICSIQSKAGTNPDSVVDVTKEVGSLTNNIICRMSFGKKLNEAQLDGRTFREVLYELLALSSSGFAYSDYIPLLGRLSLQGNRHRQAELAKILDVFMESIVDEHFERRKKGIDLECGDFVDSLISLSEDESMEIKITRDHIKNVTFDILAAATDTSAGVLDWAISELLRNPIAMKKTKEELDSVVELDRMVEESDLPNLHYLQSVVKETLRLYPPAPLLLPHESIEHATIEGYQLPKKTQLLVNVWAIARDPTHWEEASKFKPERFLGSQIDVKGHHFEVLPFGSGRRGCVGINLGFSIIHLGLAQLLHCFNWSLPQGITPQNLDMSEIFHINSRRAVPLLAIPTPRLPLQLYELNN
ncbi:hypothetical protein SUGI_1057190 [Cryptomeria japonica]|uniref:cytochrome P450 71AU50 n=1 Tax=Cryptomeria japonica TaxID=3369 RepID=UPI0024146D61|nr:cytochrome P450 71AU50 [Cryptomeria japonica]GLJ49782.1 hypothetical protein SUGI_1057190 [Cryptomeria japonica]